MHLASCAEPPPPPPVVVRDTFGITIVENHEPVWALTEGWRIDPEPVLTIDAGDVAAAVRMADGRVAILDADSGIVRFHDGVTGAPLPARDESRPVRVRAPGHMRIGAGDTLYVWSNPWNGLTVIDSAGVHVRTERIGTARQIEYMFAWPPPAPPLVTSARSLVTHGSFELREEGDEPDDPVRHLNIVARLRLELDRADTIFGFVTGPDTPPGDRIILAAGPAEEQLFVGRAAMPEFREFEGVHLRRIVRASLVLQADTVSGDVVMRPLYRGLFADRAGSVWMQLDVREGDVEDRRVVFDAGGRQLGEIVLPMPLDLLDAGEDYILGLAGTGKIVMFILHRGTDRARQ